MRTNATRTRRAVLAAVGVATAVGLLAGCGSSTPGEAAGGGGGSDGKTTVQFWHRTFTPVENEWYDDIIKKLNASQDKITVVGTEVPADAWDQKMKAAQAAGKAPDVYTFSASIHDAVGAGQLYDLGKVIDKSKLDEIIDAEKGPTTWAELMAACAKIQPTLKSGQYCISPAADAVTFAWSTVGQQYNFSGHTALTDDWTAPNIDDPGYRDLMAQYKELWDKGYMPKQALAAYVEGKDFGEGKVAYKVSGSWMMSEIGSDFPDLLGKTGIGAFPNAPGGGGRA